MAPLPQREYREIVSDLEDLKMYLTNVGLHHAPDRLRDIVANIKEIEKARAEDRLPSLNARHRMAELVWSVVEGQQLAETFRGIRDYDSQTTKRLMQKVLKGPLHPIDETRCSNEARNTFFELLLSAQFRRAGACVRMEQEADLLIDHAGGRVYIECKRPLYEHSIRKNVLRARGQLRRRLDADQQSNSVGGLVAISISKAINPGLSMVHRRRRRRPETVDQRREAHSSAVLRRLRSSNRSSPCRYALPHLHTGLRAADRTPCLRHTDRDFPGREQFPGRFPALG
jgi:hypothetical protein